MDIAVERLSHIPNFSKDALALPGVTDYKTYHKYKLRLQATVAAYQDN